VSYARLPLSFEANEGQTDQSVKFLARGRGYGLFLTGDEAVLELEKPSVVSGPLSVVGTKSFRAMSAVQRTKDNGRRTTNPVLRLKLVKANQDVVVRGRHELPGKVNHIIGNDPKKWRTNVPTYAQVGYRNVYPGVDLVYYGNQGGQLEYDFVVAPGADPSSILLAVDAAGRVGSKQKAVGSGQSKIDSNGDLVMQIDGDDEVRLHKPVVYQPEAGSSPVTRDSSLAKDDQQGATSNRKSPITNRKSVEACFLLDAQHRIQFALGPYDHTRPLSSDHLQCFRPVLA
jgi:hypothetical protein